MSRLNFFVVIKALLVLFIVLLWQWADAAKRETQTLVLDNGLAALLIYDPEITRSAAALSAWQLRRIQVASHAKHARAIPRTSANELRDAPECIVLEPRPGAPLSDKPTVRMFLGTEPAQYRAERVFIWSVEQVRDPGRRYEIHLLKELRGFDVTGWTTGFTNYRFAIPHFAGGEGRAIYNDVDQVYLADPGELFDLDLRGHGFLAVSPKDSSVALIDCAKMINIWNFDAARTQSKKVQSP